MPLAVGKIALGMRLSCSVAREAPVAGRVGPPPLSSLPPPVPPPPHSHGREVVDEVLTATHQLPALREMAAEEVQLDALPLVAQAHG